MDQSVHEAMHRLSMSDSLPAALCDSPSALWVQLVHYDVVREAMNALRGNHPTRVFVLSDGRPLFCLTVLSALWAQLVDYDVVREAMDALRGNHPALVSTLEVVVSEIGALNPKP